MSPWCSPKPLRRSIPWLISRDPVSVRTAGGLTTTFTSKKAASLFYGRPTGALSFDQQPSLHGFPATFVLSSPSGAASGHWTLQPWRELAEWIMQT